VTNDMTIAREEIFKPVLTILGYHSGEEAITIGNDTPYGLAADVQGEPVHAREVARQLRTGQVNINGPGIDFLAPSVATSNPATAVSG
jgi:aldehyde dehydrogenase (NAD+)